MRDDLAYGQAHVAALLKAAEDAGSEFLYDTSAAHLIQNWAAALGGVSPFSDDLSAEIADGSIFTADTIEGLAEQIHVPAEKLVVALSTWNSDMSTTKTASQFPSKVPFINLTSC